MYINFLSLSPMSSSQPGFPASIIIETDKSAVIQSYPWTNGIPLVENHQQLLEKHLEGTQYLSALVQTAVV
jgi:hypothetical protein